MSLLCRLKNLVHKGLLKKEDLDRIVIIPKEQEPCEDAISRNAIIKTLNEMDRYIADELTLCDSDNKFPQNEVFIVDDVYEQIAEQLPLVAPKPKTGHCKECKYFEYDSVAKVDGIPLIIAHEICKKWGDGCKTSEDGYCFLFEPQESEE